MDEVLTFIAILMTLMLSLIWYVAFFLGGIYAIQWLLTNL